ncbi:thiol:disulfide interchange protein DsbD [Betaproteobacteria bacterium]|nr:thiol:disulfide interchange protein DsbD [Betaproteobacteria bacterium]GHU04176.1 thiol:disulfide interchange protein DsbD [Betaproteobacteria bacterium]GHU20609.1 thiol:disulfide interchange protein DsbD [Betaproteobacteria bacterium]
MNTSTFLVSHRLLSCLAAILLWLSLPGGQLARAADPLEPEKAFVLSARALDAGSVEVEFRIASDYYLYGDRFKFEAEPAEVKPGEVERPPGKMKTDPYFGEVETYRGSLRMLLPVEVPPGLSRFVLTVTSQGCWDGGICYPPTPQRVEIDLRASPVTRGSSLLERAFSPAGAAPRPEPPPVAEAEGDESGRIAGLLFGARGPLVLLSFFGLGLLLAFTPCTFPMIPILSGIIVGAERPVSRGRTLTLSMAYVLGMALTYAVAGVAAGLTGTLLAAVLQNVWVLTAFALLFVVLALSMFGFFELQLPTALQSRLADSANREKGGHLGGVAVMGVLSALIVGPCVTAPLAGALLYIAKSGDAVLGGFALFVLALGMGAPLIVIALAARSVLPRIGPWMEGVKKAAGVLLLAVALWVVSPVLPAFATMLGWALLLLFSGIFLSALDPLPPTAKAWTRFWKGVGVTLLVTGIAMLVGALAGSRDPLQPLAGLRASAAAAVEAPGFEPVASIAELDARLAATERPVMLDFYADWCVSCKEMERDTFTDPVVAAQMGRMLRLQADVTAVNAEHRALLARFGLFGPPGIVFFDARGKERTDLRVVGFVPAAEFGAVLNRALQ